MKIMIVFTVPFYLPCEYKACKMSECKMSEWSFECSGNVDI